MFDRVGEGYAVTIYLPGEQRWSGRLWWTDGEAVLEADEGQAATTTTGASEPLAWALAEALKLARTLRRTPKQHMVRWRGPI